MQETSEEIVTVNNNEILTTDDGTFTSLQNKINNAAEGSTITLENDYTYNEGFSTDGISINKQLTINGNGHAINGLSKSRIFHLRTESAYETSFTFNNIKFINANANTGGAIYAESHNVDSFDDNWNYKSYANKWRLNINDCEFSNNDGVGSAVYGDYLTVSNSRFISNDASSSTIFAKYSSKITDSNFENGGAVIMHSPDSGNSYEITGCNFKNNKGAVVCWDELTVSLCTFDSNINEENGGAIYCFGHLIVKDSKFTNNQALCSGGAIYQEAGKVYITNSNFENNKALKDGGAVYVSGYRESWSSYSSTKTITTYKTSIENSIFTKNVAGGKGGAICGDSGTYGGVSYGAEAIKCTFTNNKASNGNDVYGGTTTDCVFKSSSGSSSKVTKATPKLTAKSATFKVKTKTKKYSVVLKTNKNKVIKNAKIYLKVSGKTITAKTNSKGKATFNIKYLKKKGTFKATITYKGNTNYKKVTKTIKIKCK